MKEDNTPIHTEVLIMWMYQTVALKMLPQFCIKIWIKSNTDENYQTFPGKKVLDYKWRMSVMKMMIDYECVGHIDETQMMMTMWGGIQNWLFKSGVVPKRRYLTPPYNNNSICHHLLHLANYTYQNTLLMTAGKIKVMKDNKNLELDFDFWELNRNWMRFLLNRWPTFQRFKSVLHLLLHISRFSHPESKASVKVK